VARRADEAFQCIAAELPDLLIMDVHMPGMSGMDAFKQIRRQHPKLPVIMMTGQGTTDMAIEATKLGAFEYQLKPFDPAEMLRLVERAMVTVRLMRRKVDIDPTTVQPTSDAIVGQSAPMQEVYKTIGRVAGTDATVLIRGESCTGKELVARAIYQYSNRDEKPLLIVNCVAIPEPLLESELFGHERGAFTGADRRRIGKFEQAQNGTIFLDEIGDIPVGIQAKILRVLQERTVERIGGNDTLHVNVRIVAATNRNLEAAMAQGKFREDLYHRLNVVTLRLPPLRQRREDIPKLIKYFLERFTRETSMEQPVLSREAAEMLMHHAWPGNVRELEHTLRRVVIFTRGYPIQADDVTRALGSSNESSEAPLLSVEGLVRDLVRRHLDTNSDPGSHEQLIDSVDRMLLVEALNRSGGNQTRAAKLLGLARPTLHAKMQKHGLRAG
jgi:DNA-binding NtrC family response regulator